MYRPTTRKGRPRCAGWVLEFRNGSSVASHAAYQQRYNCRSVSRGHVTDSTQTVLDSPVGWVASHIRTYLESGGAKGHHFRGTGSLLLTTRGRKSGRLRRTAVYYGRDGGAYLVVASNGGSSKHPLWYLNLREHPLVEVQVGSEIFEATARPRPPRRGRTCGKRWLRSFRPTTVCSRRPSARFPWSSSSRLGQSTSRTFRAGHTRLSSPG